MLGDELRQEEERHNFGIAMPFTLLYEMITFGEM
jgi:hypothetical protein